MLNLIELTNVKHKFYLARLFKPNEHAAMINFIQLAYTLAQDMHLTLTIKVST